MADSDRTALETRLIGAALDLAAETGWAAFDLPGVAEKADIPLDRVYQVLPSKESLLGAFGRMTDRAMLADGIPRDEETVRGRLFEVLMRRFDALQEHRAGVLAILHHLRAEPMDAAQRLCALDRSMAWALTLAGVSPDGLRGRLRRRALSVAYLSVLRQWAKDESDDLGQTMKALDKALDRLEQVAESFDRGPRLPSFSGLRRKMGGEDAREAPDAAAAPAEPAG